MVKIGSVVTVAGLELAFLIFVTALQLCSTEIALGAWILEDAHVPRALLKLVYRWFSGVRLFLAFVGSLCV